MVLIKARFGLIVTAKRFTEMPSLLTSFFPLSHSASPLQRGTAVWSEGWFVFFLHWNHVPFQDAGSQGYSDVCHGHIPVSIPLLQRKKLRHSLLTRPISDKQLAIQ